MKEMRLNVNAQYPRSELFEFETTLSRLNLDDECEKDILSGNGFIISEPQGIKKDIKAINGIFSLRYGQTLMDVNPYIDRYRCQCGQLKSRYNAGIVCKYCGTEVKEVGDNFNYYGYIKVNEPYAVIHPNLYLSIEFLIGSTNLNQILEVVDEKDEDGFSKNNRRKKVAPPPSAKDNPYYGLGMIGFREKFDEILKFFFSKSPNKKQYYDDIMKNREKVFCHSIPVFTTHLRPYRIEGGILAYEGTNAIFNMMVKTASEINKTKFRFNMQTKPKNRLLYNMQMYIYDLYEEIKNILAQKKGIIRSSFGGRYNFTSRDVIVPGPDLRCDQIRLPYFALVELLQQRIINIVRKTYNIFYHEAYKIWFKAKLKVNPLIWKIIESIINNYPEGIPFLINRNPTIQYGSIIQVYCIGINDNYTMSMPLQILPFLNADFDGDTLNVYLPQNKAFVERCEIIYNPAKGMYTSKNDGRLDKRILPARDTINNANTLIQLSRDNYSQEDMDIIVACLNSTNV